MVSWFDMTKAKRHKIIKVMLTQPPPPGPRPLPNVSNHCKLQVRSSRVQECMCCCPTSRYLPAASYAPPPWCPSEYEILVLPVQKTHHVPEVCYLTVSYLICPTNILPFLCHFLRTISLMVGLKTYLFIPTQLVKRLQLNSTPLVGSWKRLDSYLTRYEAGNIAILSRSCLLCLTWRQA